MKTKKIRKIDPKNVRIKKTAAMNDITELVFILDRSGSMAGLEKDTIGGFNGMLEKQKKEKGACYVTTVLFDHEITTLHDRVKIGDVPALTDADYTVRGCTALIDAIGMTVRRIEDIHRYQRKEDVPAHTLFVITTDGLENASREYTADQVRRMIEAKKEQGWEFLFIGANIDAVGTAKGFGIDADRAVNYHADSKGTETLFNCVSRAVSGVRACAPMQADWSAEIEEDFESRKQG